MTYWKPSFILLCLGALLNPAPALAFGNIYQDAIPHIKACISLIQEREEAHTLTEPVDLRVVCPTLTDFLNYEHLSEIDPPLENYTQRVYLQSLLTLLEAAKQAKVATMPGQFPESGQQVTHYKTEPEQKPFFLALAQWTFSHVQHFLIDHTKLSQPKYQNALYIAIVNLVIVTSIAFIILYLVTASRNSPLYVRHFKTKWQQHPRELSTPLELQAIAALQLDLQVPALMELIKWRVQEAGLVSNAHNICNAQLLAIVTQAKPQHAREMSRLIRLYDQVNYSNKTLAADEVNHALELARPFLAAGDAS